VGAGFSQEVLAERASLSVKTVAALESGARQAPYRGTVARLSDALGLHAKARASLVAAAVRPYRPRSTARRERLPPHNLPAQLSSFVGRDEVVAEVAALATKQRLVTLTGAGGMGKTRIALRAAEHLVPSWTHGTWFVDLAPLEDPDRVGERVAAVLGLEGTDARLAHERLSAALRAQHLLLVLDNCEHVLSAVAALVTSVLRACPRVSILTTSRERLNVQGEYAYRVPPLAVPESSAPDSLEAFDGIRLFVERARAVAPFAIDDATAPVVGDICRRLDGIPLAIELAAARVRELSVHDISRHLDERFRILVDGARTAIPRQRTLRSTIDWSVDALSPAQDALFRRVGIFAGGWTLDATAKVCEGDVPFDILERLSSLVEKSLVIADTARIRTRYRLLESTRLYALERLAACGEHRDVASRHARCFASFCDEAGDSIWTTRFATWLGGVAEELENVRAALACALGDDGDATIALRLSSGLGPFWRYAGLAHEGRRWLEAALARCNDDVDPRIAANAWRSLAWLGCGAKTLEAAQHAVALDEHGGDSFAIAQSRRVRALSLIYEGRFTEAEADVDHAILALRNLDMLRTIAHAQALSVRAVVLKERGCLAEAREALEAALAVYTDLGDELRAATAQGNLAELEFCAGNDRRALDLARTAGIAWRREGSVAGQSLMLANQAAYFLALGDVPGARDAGKDSLVLARRSQLADTLLPALQHLAAAAALSGDARSGALLAGYVDSRNEARGYQREITERRTYDILMRAIDAVLPAEQRDEFLVAGGQLEEDRAVELALSTAQENPGA
jgi:predicted ATPase/transcriptional regulator with XRE-family HTH domain